MKSVAGVFRTRADAEKGAAAVHALGVPRERLNLLTPNSTEKEFQKVPVTDAEPPGIGTALGAAVGGAVGISGGFWLGEVLTTLLIPGIGAIAAAGAIGAVVLGTLGAVGGGAFGKKADSDLSEGISGDELFVYEDALRQGRSVVIALTENEEQAEGARAALEAAGAETIDKARHMWWVGLRDAEKEKYNAGNRSFEKDEQYFRSGFEAAQDPRLRDKTYEESLDDLRWNYPDSYNHEAFRQGFARGQEHSRVIRSGRVAGFRATA
jgi:hypothetical protein